MHLEAYTREFLPEIETQIKTIIDLAKIPGDDSLVQMLSYHMGWHGEDADSKAQGKRIRPLLLLLVAESVGGNWRAALPAAAAVEILHNFSLIHDDIEDQSDARRGRTTLWKSHGISLALNAGDTMFTLALKALERLTNDHPMEICLRANQIFNQASLSLTQGQHLDISFENADRVEIPDYLQMISGKTAALLATVTELGALLGGASPELQRIYSALGRNIGLAFQAQDDLLGIWGDEALTGKSAASDLLTRKKTLPILFGMGKKGRFSKMWRQEITSKNINDLARVLQAEGAYDYTKDQADEFTRAALDALKKAAPIPPAGEALSSLIHSLIQREY